MFAKYNTIFDYDSMNKYFEIDSSDKTAKYSLKVSADQTTSAINLNGSEVSVNFNIRVDL